MSEDPGHPGPEPAAGMARVDREARTASIAGDLHLSPGSLLGDRYRILGHLGRGGMGDVWHAEDLKLRVEVALKALRPELFGAHSAVELLRQEVRSAREVTSPHVCRLFDLVEVAGRELVAMEYVDGVPLQKLLTSEAPLGLARATELSLQLLAGLQAIHDAGLVHRDLKPENVMLTRAGRLVIMDFGIAKPVDAVSGTVAGTAAYMPLEQVRGDRVDARSDLFAVGVILAEMVAPGGVRSLEARQAVWRGVHAEPPQLAPGPWQVLLQRTIARDPDQRFQSASALARELEGLLRRGTGQDEASPYPGLAAFTEAEAESFFGREREVEELWKKLRHPHLLALVGPSGVGKSSFLRAGLLPAAPTTWQTVVSTPGDRPFKSLVKCLLPAFAGDEGAMRLFLDLEEVEGALALVRRWRERQDEALLVVDQFEELFTLNPPEVQARFAQLLGRLALEADVHVLLAMRDDFLFACQPFPALAPLLSELTLLGPLTGAALRRALVEPARRAGYAFEDDALVEEILTDVARERGSLPLVAFAASRLWEERDRERGVLTRRAYQEIGGVGGALAGHAEATLERLGSDRVPLVRELFRNLVTAEGTRAVRERGELLSVFADREEGEATLHALIDARLLTTYAEPGEAEHDPARHRVEIIHESLLAAWPRLVRWQTQDADGAVLRDQLRQAAHLWDEKGRPTDLLWTGTSFEEFRLWQGRYPGGLSESEEAFSREMTRLAERKRRRRRRLVAATLSSLLAIVAVVVALWRQSELHRREAEAADLRTRAQMQTTSSLQLAYAMASLELRDEPETRLFSIRTLWQEPTELRLPEWVADMAFSPDGKWTLVSNRDRGIELWPRDGGEPLQLEDSKDCGGPKGPGLESLPVVLTRIGSGRRVLQARSFPAFLRRVPGLAGRGRSRPHPSRSLPAGRPEGRRPGLWIRVLRGGAGRGRGGGPRRSEGRVLGQVAGPRRGSPQVGELRAAGRGHDPRLRGRPLGGSLQPGRTPDLLRLGGQPAPARRAAGDADRGSRAQPRRQSDRVFGRPVRGSDLVDGAFRTAPSDAHRRFVGTVGRSSLQPRRSSGVRG